MSGAIPPLRSTPSWRGAQLKEAQGQLYLYSQNSIRLLASCELLHASRTANITVTTRSNWLLDGNA
jgi:hypothetical protein